MKHSMHKNDRNEVPFIEDVESSLKLVLTEEELKNPKLVEKTKRDMVRCYLLYGLIPEEYFLYDCRHESESYIKTLLSYGQKDEYCNQSGLKNYGKPGWKIMAELTDKWSFYKMAIHGKEPKGVNWFLKKNMTKLQEYQMHWLRNFWRLR